MMSLIQLSKLITTHGGGFYCWKDGGFRVSHVLTWKKKKEGVSFTGCIFNHPLADKQFPRRTKLSASKSILFSARSTMFYRFWLG